MNKTRMGKYLRSLRIKKGLSLEDLVKEFSKEYLLVSTNAISSWENGKTIPDIDNLYFLASFYGVGVDDILDGEKYEEIDFKTVYKMHYPFYALDDVSNERDLYLENTIEGERIRKRFKILVFKYANEDVSRSELKELQFLLDNYFHNVSEDHTPFLMIVRELKKKGFSNESLWWELQKYINPILYIKLSFGNISDECFKFESVKRRMNYLEYWEKDMLLTMIQRNDPVFYDPFKSTSKAVEKYEKENNKPFDREAITKETIRFLINNGACINSHYVGYNRGGEPKKERLIDIIEKDFDNYKRNISIPLYENGKVSFYSVKNTQRNRFFRDFFYEIAEPLHELGYSYDEIFDLVKNHMFNVPDEIYIRMANKKGLDTNRDIKLIKADTHFDLTSIEMSWPKIAYDWFGDAGVEEQFKEYRDKLEKGKTHIMVYEDPDWIGGKEPNEVEEYVREKNKALSLNDYKNGRKERRTQLLLEALDQMDMDEIREIFFVPFGRIDKPSITIEDIKSEDFWKGEYNDEE